MSIGEKELELQIDSIQPKVLTLDITGTRFF
jgi:hypothetical protein